MRVPLSALLLLAAASQVEAGAWPREPGAVFLSFSGALSTGAGTLLAPLTDIRSASQVFAEYGLSETWTLGLDALRATGDDATLTAELVSLRRPVWRGDGGGIAAAELGLGFLDDADGTQARIRPGLSWGRGFESPRGGGWLGVESSVELRLPSGDTAVKADFTAGLKPTEAWMLIAQVQTASTPTPTRSCAWRPRSCGGSGPRATPSSVCSAASPATTRSGSSSRSGSASSPSRRVCGMAMLRPLSGYSLPPSSLSIRSS